MARIEKYLHPFETFRGLRSPNGHRYFAFEINRRCNRSCAHCGVPGQYDPNQELSLAESFEVIDKLYAWGFRSGTILGGEPLAPFRTKERLTFYEHALALVRYGTSKGMFLGISTNVDYFSEKAACDFAEAGLDWMTESLHDDSERGLKKLLECGRMASQKGIPVIIHTLITKGNAEMFPGIAAEIVRNGNLVNATIVQEKGGEFSTKPEISLLPSKEQVENVIEALLVLRQYGLVRINRKLLQRSLDYYPNSWKCDPDRDTFLHIGAGGTLDICEEVRTGLTYKDIDSLDDSGWREQKRELVKNCTGCLYRCYYESENPGFMDEFPTFALMWLIKSGGADLVRKWGQFAADRIQKTHPEIDWSLNFK